MSLSVVLSLMAGLAPQVLAMPNVNPTQKQIVQQQKNTKGSSTRLSSSGRYKKYLMPVTKQSFKQNRRKELKAGRKKRSK